MPNPFRRKPKIATYKAETTPLQLKIIRTHMAAQADQLSSLTTLISGVDQRQRDAAQEKDLWRERIETQLKLIRQRLDV